MRRTVYIGLQAAGALLILLTAGASDLGAVTLAQIAARLLLALALLALGTRGKRRRSALALGFREQREQTAEHDRRRNTARRTGHTACEHAEQPAFRDRLGNALGERVAKA